MALINGNGDETTQEALGLLENDIPGAAESLPFHDPFSHLLDNQALRESYGNARNEVLINDGITGIRD